MTTRRSERILFAITVLGFIFVFYYLIYTHLPYENSGNVNVYTAEKLRSISMNKKPITKDNVHERLTLVIRDFEHFDNALSDTIESLEKALPSVKILIVADHILYPPVDLHSNGCTSVFILASDLRRNDSALCFSDSLPTDFILFLPDGVTVSDWSFLKTAAAYLTKKTTKAVAIPVSGVKLQCSNIVHDFKRWTISFQENNSSDLQGHCSFIRGNHGLFVHSSTFRSLPQPFARPFPFSFYVQASARNWKTRILKSARLDIIKELYKDPHASWKHKRADAERLRLFYKSVGIKKEVLSSGVSQYYGCDKNSPRCFETVLNDMPRYLYEGRWTPPCCLKALREIVAHVFSILEKSKVRYWLEGGSLLGAARNKDIIPWDYDVDVGIYKDDIPKCPPLFSATEESFTDEEDFVWEKATEGEFYRVQYSDINHLHVDIHPFYSKNGTMTKDTWMLTHRQDTEFPETYLSPLTKIEFAGVLASAPNNVKKFLEYKFGQGVIENPRYPNYQKPFS